MLTKPKESLFGTNMVLKVGMAKVQIFADQAAAVTVFAVESFNHAHPMLVGNAAEQGSRPRSCGEYPVRRQHRPAPRDGQPPLLHRPGQESFFSTNCFVSSLVRITKCSAFNEVKARWYEKPPKRKTTLAQCGHIDREGTHF